MRPLKCALLVFVVVTCGGRAIAGTLLSDTRLTVHTLVREDIFAGFRNDNMERLARAERNIDVLLKERPDQRRTCWPGRREHRRIEPCAGTRQDRRMNSAALYAEALDGFADAAKLAVRNEGVPAITGGTLATFADRLPEKHRAAAWSQAYDNYSTLWKQQGATIENLPVHFKGEVLAGLTQSAQRTGRSDEAAQYLDKMLTVWRTRLMSRWPSSGRPTPRAPR